MGVGPRYVFQPPTPSSPYPVGVSSGTAVNRISSITIGDSLTDVLQNMRAEIDELRSLVEMLNTEIEGLRYVADDLSAKVEEVHTG